MDRMNYKLENVHRMMIALDKAIDKLQQTIDLDEREFIQDSVVARFKILIESVWKVIKEYLEQQGFTDIPNSPKGVIELAAESELITKLEQDVFIKFWSLRNFATHLYGQPQYILVVEAAPDALELIKKIIARLETNLD